MLNELAKEHELTLWATSSSEQGKSYIYLSNRGINVVFNDWDQSFEFKWAVPRSIFTIECPTCSPYTNKEHFNKMYNQFERLIFSFNFNMPNKYIRQEYLND
jgi:hypothetical protein